MANSNKVSVFFSDGVQLLGTVMGVDELLDVALVKVNLAGDVPALVLGDSDAITVGQEVLAMGYPITPNSGS